MNKLRTKLNVTTSFFVGADFYVDENFSWKWNDGDLIESDNWWNEKGVKPEQPILPIWKGLNTIYEYSHMNRIILYAVISVFLNPLKGKSSEIY